MWPTAAIGHCCMSLGLCVVQAGGEKVDLNPASWVGELHCVEGTSPFVLRVRRKSGTTVLESCEVRFSDTYILGKVFFPARMSYLSNRTDWARLSGYRTKN